MATLAAALALVQELKIKDAHTFEVAPVNRRDGGTRSWHGIAKSADGRLSWAPLAKGGARPLVTLSAEDIAALPDLPVATEGYHVLHFLTVSSRVIDNEIIIDKRLETIDTAPPPPPPASIPPPASPAPAAPASPPPDLFNHLLALVQEYRAGEREAVRLALNTTKEAGEIQRQAASSQMEAGKVLIELGARSSQENIDLRKRIDELAQANVGLQGLNAQLENEQAVPKMIGEIYSKQGGADAFGSTLMGLAEMTLDALQGRRKSEDK